MPVAALASLNITLPVSAGVHTWMYCIHVFLPHGALTRHLFSPQ